MPVAWNHMRGVTVLTTAAPDLSHKNASLIFFKLVIA